MADIVSTVPFDFNELYSDIKLKFEESGYDTEEGSNTSQLITAMAYFTSMLNVNTAVNINETLLPLATQRNNVVQDARALGYEIQHKQSYSYYLTLNLTAGYSYNIPKYTEFTSGNYTYYYLGNPLTFTSLVEDTEVTLKVTEGVLYKSAAYPDTLQVTTSTVTDESGNSVPQYYIDIPYTDVEETGIEVFVTYYDDTGTLVSKEEWNKSEQFIVDNDIDLNKKFIRLDNIEFKTPRIYFKISGIGAGIRTGSIVDINVLTTNGPDGAISDISNLSSVTFNIQDTTATADAELIRISLIAEGTDEESIQSIKENAPKFFNSANRAVTKSDYEAICNRQSTVEDSIVWGGNDEFPKAPGHVWFGFKPSRYNPTLTSDNSFNTNYTLDYGTYTDWDYTYTPKALSTDPDGPFEVQLTTSETYYSSLFLENQEIRSNETNSNNELIQPGVWDTLDNFKIPTIEFHNRHPIFIDFEYDINILKYQVVNTKSSINSDVYNIINDFYVGSTSDTFKFGNFETEYFHSSLEKRIDSYLTDTSGYNNAVSTKILLTKKNVSIENTLNSYRDIYIPLSVPFESYFDSGGYLITSVLPDIDTANFLDYSPVSSPDTDIGQDLVVRWDEVLPVAPNSTDKIINAPIRITQTLTSTLSASQTLDLSGISIDSDNNIIQLYPDYPSDLETGGTPTYNEVTATLDGSPLIAVTGAPGAGEVQINDFTNITFGDTISGGESLVLSINRHAGTYYIFNTTQKFIMVHLYVNAAAYSDGTTSDNTFSDPKSYLSTSDGLYVYTIDNFYLTTEGYVVLTEDQLDTYTGTIVKQISTYDYNGSPISMDLFRRDRYLNLNYNSPNFKMVKNALPRLKRVTFS